MFKKAVAALVLLGLSVGASTSLAAPKKPIKKSYDVQAVPFPLHMGERNGVWGCLAGEEGVHKVSHKFKAPWSGRLTATVDDFTGDWDIYLMDNRGSILGGANQGISQLAVSEPDTYKADLFSGQEVYIVACNYVGGPTATVSYEFEYAKMRAPRGPRVKSKRTVEAEYAAPAVATGAPEHFFLTCDQEAAAGCVGWNVYPNDRFMSVDIRDDSGLPVAAEVYQYTQAGYRADIICGKTEKPIELLRGANFVGVSLLLGPCADGTPTAPTTGTVTATLSSHAK